MAMKLEKLDNAIAANRKFLEAVLPHLYDYDSKVYWEFQNNARFGDILDYVDDHVAEDNYEVDPTLFRIMLEYATGQIFHNIDGEMRLTDMVFLPPNLDGSYGPKPKSMAPAVDE